MTAAIVHTTSGDIAISLFDDKAPLTVLHFVGLATGTKEYFTPNAAGTLTGPYYDGSKFSSIAKDFLIQGGDVAGDGTGEPGILFPNEHHPDLNFDTPFQVAMANRGPDTNGAQFFITLRPLPHLNTTHAVFGEIVDPLARLTLRTINNAPHTAGTPSPPIVITSIAVL